MSTIKKSKKLAKKLVKRKVAKKSLVLAAGKKKPVSRPRASL
jgi:hypothetical protein